MKNTYAETEKLNYIEILLDKLFAMSGSHLEYVRWVSLGASASQNSSVKIRSVISKVQELSEVRLRNLLATLVAEDANSINDPDVIAVIEDLNDYSKFATDFGLFIVATLDLVFKSVDESVFLDAFNKIEGEYQDSITSC